MDSAAGDGNETAYNLVRILVDRNSAQGSGGGIYVADNAGDVYIESSVIHSNSASSGGGILLGAPAVNQSYYLVKSNVSHNSASNGAGLYFSCSSSGPGKHGHILIVESYVSSNLADNSGTYNTNLTFNVYQQSLSQLLSMPATIITT